MHPLFCRSPDQGVPFTYKYQIDETQEEDVVSLPYQTTESEQADNLSDSGSFDSTHFDRQSGFSGASINADVYRNPASYQNP